MTVNDNTIQAEGVGDYFKNLGIEGVIISKKMEKCTQKS